MDTDRSESLSSDRTIGVFSNPPFRSGEFLFVFAWACAFIVGDILLTVKYFDQLPNPFFLLLLFAALGCVGVPIYIALKVHKKIRESSSRDEFFKSESSDALAAALRGVYMLTTLAYFFFIWGMAILLYFVYLTLSRSGGQPFPPR
jgi:hypothetical protein